MIYLCLKIHTVSGLRYLCKTKRNPYSYTGSGIDWKKHLRQYGKQHHTEIIKVCHSNDELSYWGRYYSTTWNIVDAVDDYGNKIWANRIPETGGGGGGRKMTEQMKQKANETRNRNNTKQGSAAILAKSKVTRELNGTQYTAKIVVEKVRETRKNRNIKNSQESNEKRIATRRKNKTIYSGPDHPAYDHTIYTFYHKDGLIETCTDNDLRKKYSLPVALRNIITGNAKSYKGWRITKEIAPHSLKNKPKSKEHKLALRKRKSIGKNTVETKRQLV